MNMLRRFGPTAVGVVALLIVWQGAAMLFAALRVIPTPYEVLEQLWADRDLYPLNITTTLREALVGYFWGNLAAILLDLISADF